MKHQNDFQPYIALMLLWLLLCGCEITSTDTNSEVGLEETTWRLTAIESVEGTILFRPASGDIYRFESK